MNNTITTNQSDKNPFTALANAQTPEEKRHILDQLIEDTYRIDDELIETITELNEEAVRSPDDKTILPRLNEALLRYMRITNVSSGGQLSSSVHVLDQPAVKDLRKRLLAEYAPISASEALVVDQALNAYFRSLRLSQAHLSLIQDTTGSVRKWDNQIIINLIKDIGKQANFANQQFITAITFLKDSKQPPVSVKVHAKEAFVAQNQQFNKGIAPNDLGKKL